MWIISMFFFKQFLFVSCFYKQKSIFSIFEVRKKQSGIPTFAIYITQAFNNFTISVLDLLVQNKITIDTSRSLSKSLKLRTAWITLHFGTVLQNLEIRIPAGCLSKQ